ncbi:MAG: serine/threonine protein kinase, partial [Planctomycetes bacterium]|nr:serine/threonine protein kinase [Planctomycetota bacterium]
MTSPDKPAADDGPTPLRPEHDSILDQLERRIGAAARVVLHDPESGTSLAGRQQPGEVAADHDTGGRYRVQGLLGQGGVGAVHQGRDADLGRDVALKFLHERFKDRPDVLHRFVEEAQIGG